MLDDCSRARLTLRGRFTVSTSKAAVNICCCWSWWRRLNLFHSVGATSASRQPRRYELYTRSSATSAHDHAKCIQQCPVSSHQPTETKQFAALAQGPTLCNTNTPCSTSDAETQKYHSGKQKVCRKSHHVESIFYTDKHYTGGFGGLADPVPVAEFQRYLLQHRLPIATKCWMAPTLLLHTPQNIQLR